MNTFYEKCRGASTTLIIMEDENGHKFGGMVHDTWRDDNMFYGDGQTFVFTFGSGDKIKFWEATMQNEMFQFSDQKCIGIGGGYNEGRFSLYLGDNMYRGNSSKTECFDNECLSSKPQFLCMDMEVWGFE